MNRCPLLVIVVLCVSVKQHSALNDPSGKVAVVTGADSDVGIAIANELVRLGMQVVGISGGPGPGPQQNLSVTQDDGPGKLYPVTSDVSKLDDVVSTFNWINDNLGGISVLVSNPVIVPQEDPISDITSYLKSILDTNVLGLNMVTGETVRNMVENKVDDGHIIHISSDLAYYFLNQLGSHIFSASNRAAISLVDSLRRQLLRMNMTIRTTIIYSGPTNTSLLTNPAFFPQGFVETIPLLQPADIADSVAYVVGTPPRVQVVKLLIEPAGAPLRLS